LEEQSTETIPAYRSVARAISGRILNGTLPVGSALPSESALAQSLGINRSTVREAIRALEESGMLARRPGGKRLFVTAPRYSKVASRMKAAMVLQEMSFLELWEAMLCIEPAVTAAAAMLQERSPFPVFGMSLILAQPIHN
jgi:GntR family transcriptional repressor for pyruvate dehydrogenase complex